MIYLFGNCQTEFLGEALRGQGTVCEHRAMSTPLSPLAASGRIPGELQAWAKTFPLNEYLHGRSLRNQFQAITPEDAPPSLFVVNLFHENEPLFAHKEQGYLFFADPASWDAHPPFGAWMRRSFQQIKLPPNDYPNRLARFLAALRAGYPQTPLLVASQLSHFPAFGPRPYSYLTCWESVWREARAFLDAVARELGRCHVLDADRVFAGIWARGTRNMDAHCPFLKVETDAQGEVVLRRDLEHIGPLWPVLARKVACFAATGRLEYDADECIPASWQEEHVHEPPSVDALSGWLGTGGNYDGARGVNALLQDQLRADREGGRPHFDAPGLLAAQAERMAVCHGTLHMVRALAHMRPDPRFAVWAGAQRRKVSDFTANGPEYRRKYLEKLEDLGRG